MSAIVYYNNRNQEYGLMCGKELMIFDNKGYYTRMADIVANPFDRKMYVGDYANTSVKCNIISVLLCKKHDSFIEVGVLQDYKLTRYRLESYKNKLFGDVVSKLNGLKYIFYRGGILNKDTAYLQKFYIFEAGVVDCHKIMKSAEIDFCDM